MSLKEAAKKRRKAERKAAAELLIPAFILNPDGEVDEDAVAADREAKKMAGGKIK